MRKSTIFSFFLLTGVFFILFVTFPRILSLYYQLKGGETLSRSLQTIDEISCDRPDSKPINTEIILKAINDLEHSISYGTSLPQAYLLLGRAYCLIDNPGKALDYFKIYTDLRPNNPLGYLETVAAIERLCGNEGIDFILHSSMRGQENILDLNPCYDPELNNRYKFSISKAGIRVDAILGNAEYAYDEKLFDLALENYQRVLYVDMDNETAWSMIGKICQINNYEYKLCQIFIKHNDHNLFVDNSFSHNRLFEIWEPYEYTQSTQYSVAPCPDIKNEVCASIHIVENPPSHGAGLYQCTYLIEGNRYRYSAWVNSNADDWVPLYYQGNIDGNPVGKSYKLQGDDHAGGWYYYEDEFIANRFDERVCFYPVRLLGEGQIWFYNPRLELIEP